MKRPSYLQLIAPRAPGRDRGGVAVLSPPRQPFRPSAAAPDFVEMEQRAALPAASQPRPRRRAPLPTANSTSETQQAVSPATDAADPNRQTAPAATNPARTVPQSAPANLPRPPRQRAAPPAPGHTGRRDVDRIAADRRQRSPEPPAVAAAPGATASVSRAVRPPTMSTAAVALRESATAPPSAAPAMPERATSPSQASSIAAADHGAPRSTVATPTANPSVSLSDIPDARVARGGDREPTSSARVAASASLPVIAPPAPQPRPPLPPSARDRAASGLHIGTLEVRVVTPAVPLAAIPRAASRPRAGRSAGGGGRIARGFGVFGLGQT